MVGNKSQASNKRLFSFNTGIGGPVKINVWALTQGNMVGFVGQSTQVLTPLVGVNKTVGSGHYSFCHVHFGCGVWLSSRHTCCQLFSPEFGSKLSHLMLRFTFTNSFNNLRGDKTLGLVEKAMIEFSHLPAQLMSIQGNFLWRPHFTSCPHQLIDCSQIAIGSSSILFALVRVSSQSEGDYHWE